MIRVIKANPVAKPKIGDILYGQEYLSRVELQNLLTPISPPRLLVVSENHGFDLTDIGVDATALEAETAYDCPWTKNRYHWFCPIGVVTDDETRYGMNCKGNGYKDRPWNCRIIGSGHSLDYVDPVPWGQIIDAMLGHGYTTMTLPCDGHGNKVLATVPLDNGDELLVACWVWYNK